MEALEQLKDQAGAAFEELFENLRAKMAAAHEQAGILDSLRGFAAAVDWKEPWIVGVLVSQALLFLAVLVSRSPQVKMAVFFLAAGLVYNAERVNSLLAQRWQRFATQNYFDKHGVFFCALVSTPLLLDMFVILIQYLLQTSSLLISMKRKELRHRARQRARDEAANGKKNT
ncbi:hypothetical protein WJX81_002261 [Elliptochloris bilobata]|uniref:Transmembrane protein 18 n=1 Tax=Elliptochloris bilobata TaxID=381761 RepID=A0AAW1RML0_9CHLO